MDVIVTDAENLPDKTYVSIRIGDTRRQGPYRKDDAFHFQKSEAATLKLDLFQHIGGKTVSMYSMKNDDAYVEQIDMGNEMKVSCRCEFPGADVGAERAKAREARHEVTLQATKYLENSGVQPVLQNMIRSLLERQPENALDFMVEHLQDQQLTNRASKDVPVEESPASADAPPAAAPEGEAAAAPAVAEGEAAPAAAEGEAAPAAAEGEAAAPAAAEGEAAPAAAEGEAAAPAAAEGEAAPAAAEGEAAAPAAAEGEAAPAAAEGEAAPAAAEEEAAPAAAEGEAAATEEAAPAATEEAAAAEEAPAATEEAAAAPTEEAAPAAKEAPAA